MRNVTSIPLFPDYYIDDVGNVYSTKRGTMRIMHPHTRDSGHLVLHLRRNYEFHTKHIHQLMLDTFVGPCPRGMECRHLDGNPLNNRIDNLVWGTRSENVQDMIGHGTHYTEPRKVSDSGIRFMHYMKRTKLFRQDEIADYFGISDSLTSMILNRQRHNHVFLDC